MSYFAGTLSINHNKSISIEEIEQLLGFEENSIVDIWYGVEFHVYGKYIASSFDAPAEYAELDDFTTNFIQIEIEDGRFIDVDTNQFKILEDYVPEDSDLYWDIVTNSNI